MAIQLPLPDGNDSKSLAECTRTRQSVRLYDDSAVLLPSLSRLLWAAQGVTRLDGKRATPSAGGLYPLHIHVLARRVEELKPGLYDYLSDSHSLQPVDGLPLADAVLAMGIGDQPWLAGSAVVIAITADMTSAVQHFESQPPQGERGKRYVYMEAGAVAQNVYLHATDLELGCVLVAGFDDERAREVLGIPSEKDPVALLCVGHPAN